MNTVFIRRVCEDHTSLPAYILASLIMFLITPAGAASSDYTLVSQGVNVIIASPTQYNFYFGGAGNTTGTGIWNVGSGWLTLSNVTTGDQNTASGFESMYSNTTGYRNSAFGHYTLYNNISGVDNTAIGVTSLLSNTIGIRNSALGANTLYMNTSGGLNTAVGDSALFANDSGSLNVAIGDNSMVLNTTGSGNTAIGQNSLPISITGNYNAAIGNDSALVLTQGNQNTAMGYKSFFSLTAGNYNIGIGGYAGNGLATGDGNMFLGFNAQAGASNLTHATAIGNNAVVSSSYSMVLGGTGAYATKVGIGTTSPTRTLSVNGTVAFSGLTNNNAASQALCLTADGEVVANTGTSCITSSQRFKKTIVPLDDSSGLSEIMKLNPVSFEYNSDIGNRGTQVGFIAEQVLQVDPRLVVLDASNAPFTVRYENLTAILAKAIKELAVQANAAEQLITTSVLNVTTVHAQEFCIGSACINEDELRQLKTLLSQKAETRVRSQ